MHIFLTGGTGTIGSAVLRQAVAARHDVTALVRSTDSAATVSVAGASALLGDIAAPEAWMPTAARADVLIHLAATFDDRMATTERHLIDHLAQYTAQRENPLRLLYTGGCWLFGQTGNAVAHEASPLRPIAAFDWAVTALAALKDVPNLSFAVLHPAMVYAETGGVFSRMITALRAHRPAPIWGAEQTRWPLVHVDDAARAYLLLAHKPTATGTYNIVAEQGVPVGDIAATLGAQAGVKARPAVLPRKWVLARHGAWAEGPMLDQNMKSTRMADLGWEPTHRDYSALTYAF